MAQAAPGTHAGDPVGGEFAIAGTLPTIQDIIDFKEERKQFEYGYYRFVEHPYVRKFRRAVCSYYGVRHCLPVNSLETAFFEVLEYFLDAGSVASIYVISDSNGVGAIRWSEAFIEYPRLAASLFPKDEWPSLEMTDVDRRDLWIIAVREPDTFLEKHHDFLEKIRQKRGILLLLNELLQKELPQLRGTQFCIAGLGEPHSPVTGAVILSNADRQMMSLRNRLKRRGPVISGRNAASLLSSIPNSTPDQSLTARLTARLSELEHGSHTFLYPSGMNAIASVLDLFRTPERPQVISVGHLYSDTYTTLRDAPVAGGMPRNIFLGVDELAHLPEVISEHTSAIITESITNPLNDVPDLDFIAEIVRHHNLTFIADNTIASSYNCHPLAHGADIVVHSTTKFLSGKNNHGGGAATVRDAMLAERLAAQQVKWRNEMSPLEAAVLWDNLQDFEDRMVRFNRNATVVAGFLEHHPAVSRVYYNGLPSHRCHQTADRLLNGGSSVVSFILQDDSLEGLQKIYDSPMQHIIKAPTLGSDRTLICPYVLIAHYYESDEMLESLGLSRYLVRVAVGSEPEIEPVIADLQRALLP